MKLITPFYHSYLLIILFFSFQDSHAKALPNIGYGELDTLWQQTSILIPDDFIFSIETIKPAYRSEWTTESLIPQTTIFIGGASFKGKEKPKRKDDLFTQNIWYWFKTLFHGRGHFLTSKKSTRFLGIIRNSLYSLKFGNEPISPKQMKKNKQKGLRKVINEISEFYAKNGYGSNANINLIGSSYGSVVAAHVTLQLASCDFRVETLTLTASPIAQESILGDSLLSLEAEGKIGKIIWHPNEDDNISGASGNLSVWKLMFPKPGSGQASIILPSHPHNKAREHTFRTGQIIMETLINNDTEGSLIKGVVLDSLSKIPNKE